MQKRGASTPKPRNSGAAARLAHGLRTCEVRRSTTLVQSAAAAVECTWRLPRCWLSAAAPHLAGSWETAWCGNSASNPTSPAQRTRLEAPGSPPVNLHSMHRAS